MARYEDRRGPEELYWDEGEPYEPYEPAGGGRVRTGAQAPYGAEWSEEESGDTWTQFFPEPVREPYGGAGGTGELRPYGGRRYEEGRANRAGREYGQLYGYDQRGYGHRRDSFYAAAGAAPWWEREPPPERPGQPPRPSFAGVGPRGYTRSDERIEEEVVERLAYADWIDASDVEVQVSDGLVTLEGVVDDAETRRDAEQLAAEVGGVADVVNRLRLRRRRGH